MVCRRCLCHWENSGSSQVVMCTIGPRYGYFPKASKTWLITKSDSLSTATALFQDTEVRITSEGRPHLGSPIGTEEFIRSYTSAKVNDWA